MPGDNLCFGVSCDGLYWTFFRLFCDRVHVAITGYVKSVCTRKFFTGFLLCFLAATLLYLANDVEKNPGPSSKSRQTTIRSTPTASPSHVPENASASASTSKSDSVPSMSDLFSMLVNIQRDLTEVKNDNATILQKMAELVAENASLREENKKLSEQVLRLESKMDDLEARSKRNNLIFYGVPESENRNAEDCEEKLKAVLKDKVNISEVTFDRVHRLRTRQTPQPIIARFTFYKDRQRVLQERKNLKGSPVFISEDFPASVRAIRQKLKPTLTNARKDNKRAVMVYDHLIIDGKRWDYDPTTDRVQPRDHH